MNSILTFISLSEKDKRIIIALLIVFILFFVIIGSIYQGLKSLTKKLGKNIDKYIPELCQKKIITSPKELIQCVRYRESRRLYILNRWIIRIMIVMAVITIIAFSSRYKNNYGLMSDALKSLQIRIIWPRGSFFGIKNFIIGWPTKVVFPNPIWSFASIITYIDLIVIISFLFYAFYSIMLYNGSLRRAKEVAFKVFNQDLDTANYAIAS